MIIALKGTLPTTLMVVIKRKMKLEEQTTLMALIQQKTLTIQTKQEGIIIQIMKQTKIQPKKKKNKTTLNLLMIIQMRIMKQKQITLMFHIQKLI